jgi:hypothetical protein
MNPTFWRPLPSTTRVYESLYALNRGVEITLVSLERLKHLGMFRLGHLNAFDVSLEHTRAQANEERDGVEAPTTPLTQNSCRVGHSYGSRMGYSEH